MERLKMVWVAAFLCFSVLVLQISADSIEKRSPQRVPSTLPGANGGGIQPINRPGANGGGIRPTMATNQAKPVNQNGGGGFNGGGIRHQKRSPQRVPETLPGANGGGIQPTNRPGANGGGIRPAGDLPRPGANGGGIAPTTQKAVTLPAQLSGVPGANGGGRPPVRSPQQLPAQLPGENGSGILTTTLPPRRPGQNGGGVRPVPEKQTKPFIQQQTANQQRPAVLPARVQRSPQFPGANGGGRPPVGGHGNHARPYTYTHGHQQYRPAYNPHH